VVGKLVGVRDKDVLLVGEDPATANTVAVSSLFDSVAQKKFDDSALLRTRSKLRYWKGHYDLAFAATNATDDTLAFSTGFEVERKKTPTRFVASGSYRLATNDPSHDPESTTENELLGLLRGEYDLTQRFYAFASTGAEYDEVEKLSLRLTPKAGPGVHILKSEKYTWNVDVGPAYVYENYFGDSENKYWAISFGTDGSLSLPWGSKLTFRGDYTPAIDDWKNDYLINAKADLIFPMTEWLALKTGLLEQYNNQPANDAHKNSLTGTAGVSLVF
jgi:putative salt-induced outer membrane protein YdiY